MATRKRAVPRPKIDPLRELVMDVYCAFDAEDATPAVQVALVDGCLETAKGREITTDLATLLPHCADVLGVSLDELQATLARRGARARTLAVARGRPDELAALAALRASPGRHGATFDDAAAAAAAAAWPRLAGPALAKALFAGATDLRLMNMGPLTTLAGLEVIKGLTCLEVEVSPTCDLTPLTTLSRLKHLALAGRLEGYAALARIKGLTSLTVTASARGLAELAAVPTLRVLKLTVGPDVPLGGLLDLKPLNLLTLYAGMRALDDETRSVILALAKKKSRKLRLYPGEGWPQALELGVHTSYSVEIN